MKLFHLSDLHLGLKLINKDLEDDQRYILNQVIDLAVSEKPDAILIAGDIYDRAIPSVEAVTMFDWFISQIHNKLPDTEIMMISGNHDSAGRINQYRSILGTRNIHMIGLPPMKEDEYIEKVTLKDAFGPVNFYLLPFVKPSMVKAIVGQDENGNNLSYDASIHKLVEREDIKADERNVFVSHQFYLPVGSDPEKIERMDSEIKTVGNIDEVKADVLDAFDYAALGHIHKPMKVGSEFYRYCGTPLACSVSEAGQEKGIIEVTLGEKGNVSTRVLPLEPKRLVRVIKGELSEVLRESSEDYVTVILTDKVDLDVIDMQDRLRYAFPNLLEIRREFIRKANYDAQYIETERLSAFELCKAFLGSADEEELELLKDVINTVGEVQE